MSAHVTRRERVILAIVSVFGFVFLASVEALASVVDDATEEQLRSASCALHEMSEHVRNSLTKAGEQYLRDKDSVRMMAAYQVDDVPRSLAKCFQVHYQVTRSQRNSEQDFAHFYDMSERSIRMLILEDIARRSGADAAQIKEMKLRYREQLRRLNEEYY